MDGFVKKVTHKRDQEDKLVAEVVIISSDLQGALELMKAVHVSTEKRQLTIEDAAAQKAEGDNGKPAAKEEAGQAQQPTS